MSIPRHLEADAFSDAQSAQERLRFLAEAGAILSSSLDYRATLEQVARLAVPILGDWCVVDMVNEAGQVQRLAIIHYDAARADTAHELMRRYPIIEPTQHHTILRVLATGRSWFDPDVDQARFVAEARDPEHLALLVALGFRSEIVVPMIARGRRLGTITCVVGDQGRRFTLDDLALAEELARRAALAVDNARLFEEQHRLYLAEQQARNEAEAAQCRAAFLSEASRRLGSTLDYETTLQSVARLVTPRLADWCAIHLIADDGTITRPAVAHQDPSKELLIRQMQQRFPIAPDRPHPIMRALLTGQTQLDNGLALPRLSDPEATAELHRVLHEVGFASLLVVPLMIRRRTVGSITLASSQPRRYGAAEVSLAEELAARAALAIDNARLYREAQEAVKTREMLFSIASHELRNPLTTIRGFADLLQRGKAGGEALSPRTQRALTMIHDQTMRLDDLLGRLLDLSRLQTGQFRLETGPCDLASLVTRLAGEMGPTFARHTLAFAAPPDPLRVNGDAMRLEQVIRNLLHNAVKYSPQGGEIGLRLARVGGEAHITITDHGIGIPAAALPHLFTPFYRASNATARDIEGTGLGLYVVKEIITRHGGAVVVASQEGQGTTFTLHLPLLDV